MVMNALLLLLDKMILVDKLILYRDRDIVYVVQ
jgi:hypothetical protein